MPFLEASIPLSQALWFGLGHLMVQHWPLNRAKLELGPFYPFDNGPNGICTLLEPTVMSTNGALLIADDASRCLHLGINSTPSHLIHTVPTFNWGTGVANFDRMLLPKPTDREDCLRIQSRAAYDWAHVRHPWLGGGKKSPHLEFLIGATPDVRQACEAALQTLHTQFGSGVAPPVQMMRYPIWSTWARYKDAVTQQDVIEFANDILFRSFPKSVMGIDDRWSGKYGDLSFDLNKFPDPKKMVDQLHEMGFMVTLWVTPFADLDSEALQGDSRKYFVRTREGQVGEFEWWQPTKVAALDVTSDEACDWFVRGLKRLCTEYGIDGFKFDAGEPSFLPKGSMLEDSMKSPAEYTRRWIQKIVPHFTIAEVRSGVRGCQNAPPMFRMFDKFSTWGLENGLASVLAALLTAGILGYPFCLPDYIAGNAYGEDVPDAELLIRWAQATSAMPAMQFSIPPWSMGDECECLVDAALQWREQFFWKHIHDCLGPAQEHYRPIARPMWWEEPTIDRVAKICDQFMLGCDIVVAPVINQGETEREVFLPTGRWRRVWLSDGYLQNAEVYEGPNWIKKVSAPLCEMPTFQRVVAGE